jgi:hypothetical protein
MGEDAGGHQSLDLDLVSPIGVLALELVFERLELADCRAGKVACPGIAQRAGIGVLTAEPPPNAVKPERAIFQL